MLFDWMKQACKSIKLRLVFIFQNSMSIRIYSISPSQQCYNIKSMKSKGSRTKIKQQIDESRPFLREFPHDFKVGMRFSTPEDIFSTLQSQCLRRQLPQFQKLYTVRYLPENAKPWECIKIKCRRCLAGIHITKATREEYSGGPILIVRRMLAEHNHSLLLDENVQTEMDPDQQEPPKTKSKPTRKIKIEQENDNQMLVKKRGKVKKTEKQPDLKIQKEVKEKKPRQPRKPKAPPKALKKQRLQPGPVNPALAIKTENSRDCFNTIEQIMYRYDFHFLTEGGSSNTTSYPQIMVIVSPLMRKNYQKFGQTVSFDIFYDMITTPCSSNRQYKIGTFVIQDSKFLSKLVGLALFDVEEVAAFYKIFELFIKIHGVSPQSFMTNEDTNISKALGLLRLKKIMTGHHLYDPWHILTNINTNIVGDEKAQSVMFNGIAKLIKLRDASEFERTANALLQKSSSNREFVEVFLQKAKKVCFSKVPSTFIGIDNWKHSGIAFLLDTEKTNFQIFKLINKLVSMNQQATSGPLHVYSQKAEDYFVDKRIKQLRLRVHQKVFMRFLQNYIFGMSSFQISESIKDQQTGSLAFIVKRKNSEISYNIVDWMCECTEMQKSGVACPHLLLCAKDIKTQSFLSLVNERWVHEIGITIRSKTSEASVRQQSQQV